MPFLCRNQSLWEGDIEVGKEVKTVNCVNYEFSGERWLAGSGFRVTLGDVDINTPSLQADLGT